jgi:hypothetical protein
MSPSSSSSAAAAESSDDSGDLEREEIEMYEISEATYKIDSGILVAKNIRNMARTGVHSRPAA